MGQIPAYIFGTGVVGRENSSFEAKLTYIPAVGDDLVIFLPYSGDAERDNTPVVNGEVCKVIVKNVYDPETEESRVRHILINVKR